MGGGGGDKNKPQACLRRHIYIYIKPIHKLYIVPIFISFTNSDIAIKRMKGFMSEPVPSQQMSKEIWAG